MGVHVTEPAASQRPVFGEEWLVAVLDALEEAVIAFDVDGKAIAANPAAEQLFGFVIAEERGTPIEHLLADLRGPGGERPGTPTHPLTATITDRRPRHGVICALVTDEGVRQVRTNLNLLPSGQGSGFEDLVISVVDITELVRAEASAHAYARELEAANVQLRQVDELKSDLMSIASHELRTPVATVQGYAELLAQHWEGLPDDERRSYVEDMHGQARQLLRIIDDLLVATRLASGTIRPRNEVVNARELVGSVLTQLDEEHEVRVEIGGDAALRCDEEHGRRMLLHLVENAVKYGEQSVEVVATSDDGFVEIVVSDRGPGVSPEFVPQLFERFTQASFGVLRASSGTGVGLAIVKGLAELNGGTVRYEPNEPTGARFVLRLPGG
jgi:signal transduction histidine kinase